MRWFFWSSVTALAYTYAGYPAWLWLRSRFRARPVQAAEYTPSISIVMVVRNEAGVLEAKLQNLLSLDYPAGLVEIVVVSDGSKDATNDILQRYAQDSRVRVVATAESRGKAAGLNEAIAVAQGEIVVFTDARQKIEAGAIRLLTILDDLYIPMNVVRQGLRVTFVPNAHAWDLADQGSDREFSRKVRTLTGNYQLVQIAPWLLGASNPLRFEFVSHKLLRLFAPFALTAALIASMALPQPFYRAALAVQIAFYGLSLIAMTKVLKGPVAKVADAARTFVVLNSAAVVAFVKFVTGRRVAWVR